MVISLSETDQQPFCFGVYEAFASNFVNNLSRFKRRLQTFLPFLGNGFMTSVKLTYNLKPVLT